MGKTSWDYSEMPDLEGKVAVVTGATGGIGLVTATKLAAKGATVVVPGRTQERAEEAAAKIRAAAGGRGRVVPARMDQMDLASVDAFAKTVGGQFDKVDLLVNNAGIMAVPFALSKDGIESQFATNHFSHFLLTARLLPLLVAAPEARVVNVSSIGHKLFAGETDGSIYDLKAINDPAKYSGSEYRWYGETKAANIMHARELQRRLLAAGHSNVYVNACHPGNIATNLGNNAKFIGRWMNWLMAWGMLTPEQGALTQTYLATAPELAESSKPTQDPALQKKLWEWSEKVLAEKGFKL
ncbi:hypothetical protein DFJ74DRAFT_773336 [Hyaloraphidium curvatum]|nr:hypothetical protein DFJ74DRAFT_773336 [Hyaloraphidium curvatum]